MSTIKVETIRRNCADGLAVEILADRGLISETEAQDLYRRCRAKQAAWAARIYGWRIGAEAKCANCGEWIEHVGPEPTSTGVWVHEGPGRHTVCDWIEGMEPTDRVATPAVSEF